MDEAKLWKWMDDDEEASSRERISTAVIETLERGWSDRLPLHD